MTEYNEKVKRLMGKIGQAYYSALPNGWSFFQVIAVMDGINEDVFLESFVFQNEDFYRLLFETADLELTDAQFAAAMDGRNAILELRDECYKQGDLWVKIVYTLDSNGHFHCDFKYSREEA